MCIRDRREPGRENSSSDVGRLNGFDRFGPKGDPDQLFRLFIGQRGRKFPDPGPEPVSYTHLRAHETVLDLVCRLLLEKKKA